MTSVFEYTDYRELLKDYYNALKTGTHEFTIRQFAAKAGFRDKTFLLRVLAGERQLSRASAVRVAQALGLKRKEVAYFQSLVYFNRAKKLKDREYYFSELQRHNRTHKATTIRQEQFAYFSDWYNVVIRELVTIKNWKSDWKALGQAVCPPINAEKAKNSVDLLLRLGMIRTTASGRYEQVDRALTAGDPVTRMGVHKFQRETMTLASRALDRFAPGDRDISTMTVGLSKEGFAMVSEEMREFRKYVGEIAENDTPAQRVYQVNFQLYPVSAPTQET